MPAGLARFDGVRFTPVNRGPMRGAQIGGLCGGRDGSLWVALEGQGALRWGEEGVLRCGATNGLNSNFVRALCEGRDGSVSCPEAATRLGIPLGTVTETLSRAYALLRQELKARESAEATVE